MALYQLSYSPRTADDLTSGVVDRRPQEAPGTPAEGVARLTPSDIGARAESAVAAALIAAGRAVYVPLFCAHGRIDLITSDDQGGLLRVQCKTSRLIGGVVSFSTCSNSKNQRQDYEGQVDAFGVYSPELSATFLVPAEGLPRRACSLRLGPARNGQIVGVRWARDYALSPIDREAQSETP